MTNPASNPDEVQALALEEWAAIKAERAKAEAGFQKRAARVVATLRTMRWSYERLAAELGLSNSTVNAYLDAAGVDRMRAVNPNKYVVVRAPVGDWHGQCKLLNLYDVHWLLFDQGKRLEPQANVIRAHVRCDDVVYYNREHDRQLGDHPHTLAVSVMASDNGGYDSPAMVRICELADAHADELLRQSR